MNTIKIESDFSDYYDFLSDSSSNKIYKRYRVSNLTRVKALKKLSNLSINTLELRPVSSFLRHEYPIVVYTDMNLHGGMGKKIVNFEEANSYYLNCVGSRYLVSDDNCSTKFIQLGTRRFIAVYRMADPLRIGQILDLKEVTPAKSDAIDLPIYSIDYIQVASKPIATDFNEIVNFNKCGLSNFIPPQEVVNEIIKVL